MKATQLEFPEWWDDFLAKGGEREDFYECRKRLLRFVDTLPAAKLDAFTTELADLACRQAKGWSVALGALEMLPGRAARQRLAAVALNLPAVHPPHPQGDYRCAVLRVLATDQSDEFLGPVDAFFNGEIGLGFTSVLWALWPHDKDRFGRYYARYFAGRAHEQWSGTAVVQAFVTAPEALTCVREHLLAQQPATWALVRTAVLAACSASWVIPEQAREIERVCGQGAPSR